VATSPLIGNTLIDSCAFDPKYEPEATASAEIFRLSQQMRFMLVIAHSTQKEIEHPKTPAWVKQRAQQMISSLEVPLEPTEKRRLRAIETILAGKGRVDNVRQDARHVFEAQKYGRYFITTDERILSRARALQELCHVIVLKLSEFLALLPTG
jgi:hypothetical protein